MRHVVIGERGNYRDEHGEAQGRAINIKVWVNLPRTRFSHSINN